MSSTKNSSPMPIMHNEKSAVVENRPLLQPSKHDIFPLLELPCELRDPIYRYSISAGNLEILRINKLVNEEASQLLPEHAVLRVKLGFTDRTHWVNFGTRPSASVQRVELGLSTGPGAIPFDIDLLSGFADNQITRESCVITLNYGKEGNAPFHIHRHGLYLQLARLKGFKSLVVKIVIGKYEAAEFAGLLTEEQFWEVFPYESGLLSHHIRNYEKVRKFLEFSLGPAKFDSSVEDHHLEFHPLEPVPEDWKPEFEYYD